MKRYAVLLPGLLLLSTLMACHGALEMEAERTSTPEQTATATVVTLPEKSRLGTQVAPLATPTLVVNLGRLAYLQGGDIWVRELPGGEPRRLTTDGINSQPRWSPSGQWLALRKRDNQVWLMRGDGSDAHALHEGRTVGAFAWAPGEERLAYVAEENELRAINADGSAPAVLVLESPFGRVGRIAWSPDGAWVAYEWQWQDPGQPASLSLHKVAANGQERIRLYEGPATLAGWTGNGRFLFFWGGSVFASASLLADGVPLYALPAGGGAPTPLAESVLAYPDFVVVEPAGTERVAIVAGGFRGAWTNKTLHVVVASTGESLALTPPDLAASSPAWSPDGQHIACVAMPERGDVGGGEPARQALMGRRLWVVSVDGQPQAQRLTDDPAYRDEYPLWSADGSHILFARLNIEGQASLWLIPAAGGEPQQVVKEITPAPEWFGYYGHIDWDDLYDWWRGPAVQPEATTPTPAPVATSTPTPAAQPPEDVMRAGEPSPRGSLRFVQKRYTW